MCRSASIAGLRQPGRPCGIVECVAEDRHRFGRRPVRRDAEIGASDAELLRGLPGPVVGDLTVGGDLRGLMPRSVTTSLFGNTAPVTLTDAALAAELAQEAGELLLRGARRRSASATPYDLGDAGDKRANTLILDGFARSAPTTPCSPKRPPTICPGSMPTGCGSSTRSTAPGSSPRRAHRLGRAHRALAAQRGTRRRRHHRRRGGAARVRRGLPHRHRHPAAAARAGARSASPTSAQPAAAVLWWLRDQLDIELVGIGSAGAKAMAVVRGDVDAYVHAGGQWEWDSAAPAGVCWRRVCTRRAWTARR